MEKIKVFISMVIRHWKMKRYQENLIKYLFECDDYDEINEIREEEIRIYNNLEEHINHTYDMDMSCGETNTILSRYFHSHMNQILALVKQARFVAEFRLEELVLGE